jgi:hypothetical protein
MVESHKINIGHDDHVGWIGCPSNIVVGQTVKTLACHCHNICQMAAPGDDHSRAMDSAEVVWSIYWNRVESTRVYGLGKVKGLG